LISYQKQWRPEESEQQSLKCQKEKPKLKKKKINPEFCVCEDIYFEQR
jgi:hypothetical protein